MTVLVAGATGSLGLEICRRLTPRHRVRALVRPTADPARLAALQELGVATVAGDLKEPDSLRGACLGAPLVVSTASATLFDHHRAGDSIRTVDAKGNSALVDAAREAGAGRFLFVSSTSRDDSPATQAKRTVEERLRASGLRYTIVRANRFMEIWLTPMLGFDPWAGTARIFGAGDRPVSWVSRDDVATFVALVLDDSQAEGETIEVGGPEALSQLEVVARFEQVAGRRIALEHVSEHELRAERAASTDPLLESYAAFALAVAGGDRTPMEETLRRFPMSLTSVREYAERAAAAS